LDDSAPLDADAWARLRTIVLEHAITGPDQRQLLAYLFDQRNAGVTENLDAWHVGRNAYAQEKDASRTGTDKHRVNERLLKFFDTDAIGKNHPWRVRIGDHYALVVERNRPAAAVDLVKRLWAPYIGSSRLVRVLYPEVLSFKDSEDTYLRNPRATRSEQTRVFSYLRLKKNELKPNYSLVQAGVVRAMMVLLEALQPFDVHFRTGVVRPDMTEYADDEHLIVLGTPSTNPLVATYQSILPAHWTNTGLATPFGKPLADDYEEDFTGEKWALFTRRVHLGRTISILSAKHGRTVEALTTFLTRQNSLQRHAEFLEPKDSFPPEFQTIFKVVMSQIGTEPHIESIDPYVAL
jgi:hypothetical protein